MVVPGKLAVKMIDPIGILDIRVLGRHLHHLVHIPATAHDFHPLLKRDERLLSLHPQGLFIRYNPNDQIVAHLFTAFQQIQMSYVEQVEHPCRVSDMIFLRNAVLSRKL